MGKKPRNIIERRALKIVQHDKHPIILFSLTGSEILKIADISRISRDDAGDLIGYQRPEVKRHIQDIVNYLNSESILFPNSIILALASSVKFKQSRGPKVGDGVCVSGSLEIPVPGDNDKKPAWIVDGQQRAVALSMSNRRDLVVPVNAFIADELEIQRDQFIRVNNTRPLPRGLLTELLPEVSSPLPAKLQSKKIPSAICDWLSREESSPFHGLLKRASTPKEKKSRAIIADTSIVKVLEESLHSPSGCLFPYRNIATGETDFDGIWALLVAFWCGVKNTFPDAWGKPPSKSRLMHGVGIRAMGRLMDKVMTQINPQSEDAIGQVEEELRLIAPLCRWTKGQWEELGGLAWDDLQNNPQHISRLTSFLIRAYLREKR